MADLKKLLTIGTRTEDIFSVIGRMQVLLDEFKKDPQYNHFIPFLKVYYLVTKMVAEKAVEKKGYFDDYKSIERLDVYFASLYFRPMAKFLETGKSAHPWQVYTQCCQIGANIPFLQVLLGINAHINADLLQSLLELKYFNKKDYEKINKILIEVIPELFRYLIIEEHDVFGFSGVFTKSFIIEEFEHTIVKWRKQTFRNALFIKKQRDPEKYIKSAQLKTEKLGLELIHIFTDFGSYRNPIETVRRLNKLEVKIR